MTAGQLREQPRGPPHSQKTTTEDECSTREEDQENASIRMRSDVSNVRSSGSHVRYHSLCGRLFCGAWFPKRFPSPFAIHAVTMARKIWTPSAFKFAIQLAFFENSFPVCGEYLGLRSVCLQVLSPSSSSDRSRLPLGNSMACAIPI
jgi:hypothetical protein